MTCAKCANAASSVATSAWEAPFCGPNTALAPVGPVSGLVTSQAAVMETFLRAGSIVLMSMVARSARAAPPCLRSLPFPSRRRTPRACRSPAPASLVALPPSPTMMRLAPERTAASMSSPVP